MKSRTTHTILFAVGLSLMAVTACKTPKTVVKDSGTPTPPPVAKHITVSDIANADFSTLAMNFSTELMDIGVSGQVRIQKDKVIWISVSKLLELGRVKMTPDSVYATVKLKNQAFRGTYNQFQKQFGIAMNFDIAQALLVGNDISGYQQADARYAISGDVTNVSFAERKSPRQSIAVKHDMKVDNRTRKVLYHYMVSSNPSQTVKADYSNFQSFGKVTLPTVADLNISASNMGNVSARLNYTKIQANTSLTFPISISKRAKPLSF
ncbi:MAG: DUF4292 domain-containing protein [Bacteroidales bacterium]|nr:DUF4292 domain-containing protein [Bacteroidales bacterium]